MGVNPKSSPFPDARTDGLDELLHREFALEKDLIYLNHAAVAPWPRCTVEAVSAFARENGRSGARDYARWVETERRLRAACAQLLNAGAADDIAFAKNTSEALSFVAHGFPWKTGDNLVIPAGEFPSNRIVWQSLAAQGVETREIDLTGAREPERAFEEAIDERTRLMSVSSVQYASGLRLDLARLGEACKKKGVAFCVDAIQGLGALPHDVSAMHIDFLAADAHKWLLGPEGIAVFYCRSEWRERLVLRQYGWHMVEHSGDYDRLDWSPARSARRFEPGSPNMLGVHALSASLSLLLEIGIDIIERRVLDRAQHMFARLRSVDGVSILTPTATGRFAGIVTFKHATLEAAALFARLRAANIVCAARGGGIRFSPHFYTPTTDLDRAIEHLAAAISAR